MFVSRAAARALVLVLSCSTLLTIEMSSQTALAQQRVQQQDAPPSYDQKKRETNDISLNVVVSGISCTCARFAEDIRNVVNDLKPDGIRLLPVIGNGGLQNLNDVLFLKGIDMGVVDEDNLYLLKRRDPKLYANIEQRVQYITKLYNSEFHLLARNEITSVADLRGKVVNFNLKDSQTEVTAQIVFDALRLDVKRTNYDNDEAIKKLRSGEIAAMIILTGAPQAQLAKLKAEDNVHFLALDRNLVPPDQRHIFDAYLPGELTNEQYPNLIAKGTSVPTIDNRALLVAYAWPENSPRYKRLAKFVNVFFSRIEAFNDGARHPKWKEVNLAADIADWTRFKPAADWLAGRGPGPEMARADAKASPTELKAAFEQFVQSFDAKHKKVSPEDQERLYARFQLYLQSQQGQRPVR
jgi:uncharacterized protein